MISSWGYLCPDCWLQEQSLPCGSLTREALQSLSEPDSSVSGTWTSLGNGTGSRSVCPHSIHVHRLALYGFNHCSNFVVSSICMCELIMKLHLIVLLPGNHHRRVGLANGLHSQETLRDFSRWTCEDITFSGHTRPSTAVWGEQ